MTCPRCGAEGLTEGRPCPTCGLARGDTISERAERRHATVLFADISGFTALSEVTDPEIVREITNECLGELASVVHRYGGTVLKYIGDAVMAAFGAPNAHEDDPERAVAAALEMRQTLDAASLRLSARLPQPLTLHIGINTGLVVAGLVGSTDRSHYDVLGDAVNLAARLEDLSEGGEILVSEETHRATEHAFAYNEREPVLVKGKREPIKVFELLGARVRRRSQRGLPGTETPFVGRERELATLLTTLDAMAAGRGGLITLSGPAGVGKSRLVRELRRSVEERKYGWVQAGATSLAQSGALALWSEAIRRLLAYRSGTDMRTAVVERQGGVDAVLPPSGRSGASAALAEVLGLTLPPQERHRLQQLDETALRGQLFLAVRELLQAQARARPLVLVLEDLHWADEASFDLLHAVVELTARVPLLIVGTYRTDATTVTAALARAEAMVGGLREHIEVSPLSLPECEALALAVLGQDDRLAPVRRLLVERAEGNPLYLEEILRALAQQGAIAMVGKTWRLTTESIEAELPPSLQYLLLDRIDRLPEQRKRLLQIASVAGRQFPPELVSLIAGEGESVRAQLDDLIREGFLEPVEGGVSLRFRHALMQEAAYSSLLLRHRRSYHRRVAELLEARPELWGVRTELAAVLTNHWERAEEWERAADWATRSADQARRAFAPAEAIRLYARALNAANRSEDRERARAALAGIADAALAVGDAEQVLQAAEQALALEPAPLERASLERHLGQAYSRLGMQASAAEAFQRAAGALGDSPGEDDERVRAERATLRIQVAFSHLARGAVLLARAAAEEALRLHVGGGDEADAHRLLGLIDLRLGEAEQAARRFSAALDIVDHVGDLPRRAVLTEHLATAALAGGERDRGLELLRSARDQYARLGDNAGAARCLEQLSQEAFNRGELAAAVADLREAVSRADAADERLLAGRAGLQLGRALALLGDWRGACDALLQAGADDEEAAGEAALERCLVEVAHGGAPEGNLRVALAAADRAGRREVAARARLGLATILRRAGRREEARDLYRAVLESGDVSDPDLVVSARTGLAQIALAEGNARAAAVVAARALALAEEQGVTATLWTARRVYSAALAATGRNEAAERELRDVVTATREAGALPELQAALSVWARVRRSLGDPTGAADALAELREVVARLGEAAATVA
jgi:adenylate cyclase